MGGWGLGRHAGHVYYTGVLQNTIHSTGRYCSHDEVNKGRLTKMLCIVFSGYLTNEVQVNHK